MDSGIEHPGFRRAVDFFGSQSEIARALKISPQAVSKYRFEGFSAESAIELERISGGELKALDVARQRDKE